MTHDPSQSSPASRPVAEYATPPLAQNEEQVPGESPLSWMMQLICIGVVVCLFVLVWMAHLAFNR